LKLKISKAIIKIRNTFARVLLGRDAYNSLLEIEKIKSQIDFMTNIMSEQSRLIASIALVQSDLAKSVAVSEEHADSSSDYLLLKIPMSSDDFLN